MRHLKDSKIIKSYILFFGNSVPKCKRNYATTVAFKTNEKKYVDFVK